MDDLLNCKRQSGNPNDSYAVAIKNGASVIGHIPRKLLTACRAACSLFLSLRLYFPRAETFPHVDYNTGAYRLEIIAKHLAQKVIDKHPAQKGSGYTRLDCSALLTCLLAASTSVFESTAFRYYRVVYP